jgi:DNA polymerase/3'-5' exonuclease PolX
MNFLDYPNIGKWEQGKIDNLSYSNSYLSTQDYELPNITIGNSVAINDWYTDLSELQDEDNLWASFLTYTGSYTFNIYMRKIALEKGYSLSEYGLKGKDKQIIDTSTIINSEEDIFKFLNITYVPPNKRNIV